MAVTPEEWIDPNTGATLPEEWIAAYEKDDNVFWRCDIGHIMNVVDHLLDERREPR